MENQQNNSTLNQAFLFFAYFIVMLLTSDKKEKNKQKQMKWSYKVKESYFAPWLLTHVIVYYSTAF